MAGAGRGRRWTESSSSSRMQFHILQRQCDYSRRVHKSLVGPLDELASAPVHSPHTMQDEMFGRYRCVGPSLPSPIHLCSRFLIKQHVLEPLRACASVSVHRSFPSFPRSLLDDHPITSRIVAFARFRECAVRWASHRRALGPCAARRRRAQMRSIRRLPFISSLGFGRQISKSSLAGSFQGAAAYFYGREEQ